MLYTVFLVFEVLLSIALIALVLMQHGKGADAGAAFGSGASGTVFGSRGAGNFLSRTTGVLGALFFINCLVLAFLATRQPTAESIVDSVMEQAPTQDVGQMPVMTDDSAAPIPQMEPTPAQQPVEAPQQAVPVQQQPAVPVQQQPAAAAPESMPPAQQQPVAAPTQQQDTGGGMSAPVDIPQDVMPAAPQVQMESGAQEIPE